MGHNGMQWDSMEHNGLRSFIQMREILFAIHGIRVKNLNGSSSAAAEPLGGLQSSPELCTHWHLAGGSHCSGYLCISSCAQEAEEIPPRLKSFCRRVSVSSSVML